MKLRLFFNGNTVLKGNPPEFCVICHLKTVLSNGRLSPNYSNGKPMVRLGFLSGIFE
jgi:nitrate/TMAO reductase-like tetraheme cytochrome c subunit